MGVEIERKFLVVGENWRSDTGVLYSQGYLNRDKLRTVRVRLVGEEAWLTVKGKNEGAVRAEFEYSIPPLDARSLLDMCEGSLITKQRHVINYEGITWEIDEFLGENKGLVVAEVELNSIDQSFCKPDWIGLEVTDDPRYFNSNLSRNPYLNW